MIEWDDQDTPETAEDDLFRDPFRAAFSPTIEPLPPRPGTFAQITRRARRRRMLRSAAAIVSAAAGVAVVGLAGIEARQAADHPAAMSQKMSPNPSGQGAAASATPAAARRCSSTDISVTTYEELAAPARIGFTLLATNRSGSPCSIAGYPAATLRSDKGSWAPLTASPGGTRLADDPGSRTVTLAPGASATAEVEWSMPLPACQGSETADIPIVVTVPGGATLQSTWPSGQNCAPADAAVTALKAFVAEP